MGGMERHYQSLLQELLTLFPCVALIGVRQCGKTTLLRTLPPSWQQFDLEKASDYQQIATDPDLFLRLHSEHIAIDEAQLLPEVFSALRVAIDSNRKRCGRYVITGSSSPELLSSISESLAGRVAIVEMGPFSPSEAHGQPVSEFFKAVTALDPQQQMLDLHPRLPIATLFDYWLRGGYPEPWLKNNPRFHKTWVDNYFGTYIDRDMKRLFPGINQQKYRLFIQMLGSLSGKVINYSEVARALSVSQPTVRDYFHIAHGTFLWRHLPAFEKDATKRIVKHPKGYLRDSGLLHFLLHLHSVNELLAHPQMGHSFEAMAIETILRGLCAQGISHQPYHYRTAAGAEVDLILEGEFGLLPIEIKYTQQISPQKIRGIKSFMRERNCRYGVVVHNGERVQRIDDRLIAIPLACL